MRIRKRLASQCGAAAAAGVASQSPSCWQRAGAASNLGAQSAGYKHPQRHKTEEQRFDAEKLEDIHHGRPVATSPASRDSSFSAPEFATPELWQAAHDSGAHGKLQQQLQAHEQSPTYGIFTDAIPASDADTIDVVPSCASGRKRQVDAGTSTSVTTMPPVRVLQTGGQPSPCLPFATSTQPGQLTQTTGLQLQFVLDKRMPGSSPLPKVDHNKHPRKQAMSTIEEPEGISRDYDVKASKVASTCDNDMSIKFRTFLPEVITDKHEQENPTKSVPISDAHYGEEDQIQVQSEWDGDDHHRCSRRSGQGWQCKNKRAVDGDSIYCNYHQFKITQHHAAWNSRKKTMKENKRRSRQSSWPETNMVDVKVLELPLFPSRHHMYGNLQAQDKKNTEAGAILKMSQAASYAKSDICTDDLDLKLAAPNSVALPNLVETEMPTKPSAPCAQNTMEFPIPENFSFKRRKVESVAASETRTTRQLKHKHSLTEVDILCAGPEHLNAIRLFGSALCVVEENTNRGDASISNRHSDILIVGDEQTRAVGHVNPIKERKILCDRTVEEKQLAQIDNFNLQQVPYIKPCNSLIKEQQQQHTNSVISHIEADKQGHLQQHQQCKRHDGRGWRCKQMCAQGKFYCEHHARKQRRYANKIKTENKSNGELQQRLLQSQQVESRRNAAGAEDKTKSNRTGTLHEVHQEPCIKDMTMSEAKHAVGSQCKASEDLDHDMQDKGKRMDKHEHERKVELRPIKIEPEPKLQAEKAVTDKRKGHRMEEPKLQVENAVADKHEGQDRMERVHVADSKRRCGRQDGRGWQCKRKCMQGSVYCEHHKERLKRYHANWSANCVLKKQRRRKLQQTVSSASTSQEQEIAVVGDANRKEKHSNAHEQVKTAPHDAPCKRKRRSLHHIYARCGD